MSVNTSPAESGLSLVERVVLLDLRTHAEDVIEYPPSEAAERLEINKRSVSQALRTLDERGLIAYRRGSGRGHKSMVALI